MYNYKGNRNFTLNPVIQRVKFDHNHRRVHVYWCIFSFATIYHVLAECFQLSHAYECYTVASVASVVSVSCVNKKNCNYHKNHNDIISKPFTSGTSKLPCQGHGNIGDL